MGKNYAMTEAGTIGTRARERCGEEHIDRAGGWKMMEDVLVFLSLVSRNTTCIKFWVDSNFWRKKTPESCFIGDSDIFWISSLMVVSSTYFTLLTMLTICGAQRCTNWAGCEVGVARTRNHTSFASVNSTHGPNPSCKHHGSSSNLM